MEVKIGPRPEQISRMGEIIGEQLFLLEYILFKITLKKNISGRKYGTAKSILFTMAVLLVASCGGDSNKEDPVNPLSYSVKISSQEEVQLNQAQIKIDLYGTHRYVADNAATLLSSYVRSIDRTPHTINLQWPENGYQLIDSPPVSNQEDAKYYLTIRIDANGDGVICAGDYIQDFDETPHTTIDGIPSETVEFKIKPADNESCYMF